MERDFSRYHRQMLLPGFGADGQARLGQSTALLLGCGALGSVAADMLSRAGVGHLVIVDRDVVELTNLQRQVLFDERDVAEGLPKAEAARRKISAVNSSVRVTSIVDDINHTNIERFAEGADILVDGLDNFETRYLANDLAVKRGLPYVYGAAVGTTGMAFSVLPHTGGDAPWESHAGADLATPCFRCLFDEAPPPGTSPTCETAGVLGAAVAIVANFQVAEALKILTGNFERVTRTLLTLDLWTNEILQLKVANAYEKGDCQCCKHRRFEYLDGQAGSSAVSLCGRNAVQLRHRQQRGNVDLDALGSRLRAHGKVTANGFLLRAEVSDGNGDFEITLFPDGRAIVKGTDDPAIARGMYAKYVGG
ncbi:MAG: ThiF family adenylyltransferase [Gammaproteobacteria bacterium]|nr:ThiF family adenylyltransferase [Gammaproteobacteria bacterium]